MTGAPASAVLTHVSVRALGVSLCAASLCLGMAVVARAADRIYWANAGGDPAPKISFVNLNGTGGGSLNTKGASPDCCPTGVAIDIVAGKVYWSSDSEPAKISFARLDGSGGGDLNTAGATVSYPDGIAIDPGAGLIYWANDDNPGKQSGISFARLDGSGGGDLNTAGATVDTPGGVAVDPASGRIYWSNRKTGGPLSYAGLSGGGGGDLSTPGATVDFPWGLALDAAAGRIYWANSGTMGGISLLDLSGVGADLSTAGATVSDAVGPSLDPAAGRIYWANRGLDKISFANLGGGGGDLGTAGATVDAANFTALLKAPSGAGAPTITVKAKALDCSEGTWAPDLLESFLYRRPRSFAYQWSRNGIAMAGALGGSVPAGSVGNYACRVTAQNQAGSASQTSVPYARFKIGRPRRNRRRGTATIPVTVPDAGTLILGGKGVARLAKKARGGGTVGLLVRPRGKRRRKLNRKGRIKLRVRVAFRPALGTSGSQTRKVRLVKRRR
jgi:hypothetical protein